MRVLVGVGATSDQLLAFQVLKHSILSKNNVNDYTVELISEWDSYSRLEAKLGRVDYGTVFSLQRFVVAEEASNRGYDVFVHLDSDMLCIKSLDSLVSELKNSQYSLVVPSPHPDFKQPFQTAVFCGEASASVVDTFAAMINSFKNGGLSYSSLMRFNYEGLSFSNVHWRYNSRDYITDDTVVFHMTDLYRQPWVSPFSNYNSVWSNHLEAATSPEVSTELSRGVKRGIYRPGLRAKGFQFKDLMFTPPQFETYRIRYLERPGVVSLVARSKSLWTIAVHTRGLIRMVTNCHGV